jgi:hypothetical protein
LPNSRHNSAPNEHFHGPPARPGLSTADLHLEFFESHLLVLSLRARRPRRASIIEKAAPSGCTFTANAMTQPDARDRAKGSKSLLSRTWRHSPSGLRGIAAVQSGTRGRPRRLGAVICPLVACIAPVVVFVGTSSGGRHASGACAMNAAGDRVVGLSCIASCSVHAWKSFCLRGFSPMLSGKCGSDRGE